MKKTKQLLLAMGVLATLANTAYAEEVLPTYDLDPTVVTATKSEEKLLHTSADVSVITGKEIERMHYKTLTDVLKTVPNVQFLNYNQNYNLNKILINGDHHVIVLLNGVRISRQGNTDNYPMGYGFNLVRDMSDVQRIEVLKGAASVQYGSDAKGGVINIITKDANKNGTTITTENGNFGHEHYGIKQDIVKDKLSLSLYANRNNDGTYKDGQGRIWNNSTKTDEIGFNGRLFVGKNDSGNIKVNYDTSKTKARLEDFIYKQLVLSEQNLSTLQVSYNQEFDKGWENALTYNRNITKNNFVLYTKSEGSNNYDKLFFNAVEHNKTQVFNDTITKTFDERNKLTFGYEKSLLTSYNKNIRGTANTSAFFSQYSWDFAKNWNLLAGYRYDKFNNADSSKFKAKHSKSFTLTHDFDKNLNAYIAYNEFFIAPDSGMLFSSLVGNSNLLPEIGNNKELGINYMTKDGTLINAHYFNRHSENVPKITKAETTYGWQYKNSNDSAHGVDLNVMKAINDKWTVKAGWSHLSMKEQLVNYTRGYLASNIITLGAAYKYKKLDAGIDVRGFIGRLGDYRYPTDRRGRILSSMLPVKRGVDYRAWPSGRYYVTDLSVNYKPTKDMKVFLKINNLFNIDYAYHTDYFWHKPNNANTWYSMPGRSFILGMQYKF